MLRCLSIRSYSLSSSCSTLSISSSIVVVSELSCFCIDCSSFVLSCSPACAGDTTTLLRISAIEALRRLSCSSTISESDCSSHSGFLSLFRDFKTCSNVYFSSGSLTPPHL